MTVPAGSQESLPPSRRCNRCKEAEGTLDLRNAEIVCPPCFASFIFTKTVKRLEVLQRETRPTGNKLPGGDGGGGPPAPQRYLVALSCGPSSTALLHILHENFRRQQQQQQQQRRPRCELVVVHVVFDAEYGGGGGDDDDGNANHSGDGSGGGVAARQQQEALLDRYRARFPGVEIRTVDLSSVIGSSCVDWTALPLTPPSPLPSTSTTRKQRRRQLAELFARLPSATSRADIRRLLTRHALLAAAASSSSSSGEHHRCDAVLLGHSTTALAELTLAETAKGRGFSLPWQINDGLFPAPSSFSPSPHNDDTSADADAGADANASSSAAATTSIPVYHPLREIFRKELLSYAAVTTPPLAELLSPTNTPSLDRGGAVVSHRDLSIDDVMARYFGAVEASYPSVVANVVRTTGKLSRTAGGEDVGGRCGLCSIALDKSGDERWRGEIGVSSVNDDEMQERDGSSKSLCYGCERSTRG